MKRVNPDRNLPIGSTGGSAPRGHPEFLPWYLRQTARVPIPWLLWSLAAASFLGWRIAWETRLCPAPVSRPARNYGEALARLASIQAAESTLPLHPVCRTQFLDHGRPTPRTVVLLHGFTNCPHQFHLLARECFERGNNVLIPRLPRHGLATRLPTALARLTAEEAAAATTAALDIARGLGEEVLLLGFSFGGVLAGWAAQHRGDLARAVLVSPAFGLGAIPQSLTPLAAHLFALWPNTQRWWDPVQRERAPGPDHAYAGYASRGVATLLRLSLLVQRAARRRPPATRSITLVTNPCDRTVRNEVALQVATWWQGHGASVQHRPFPAEWQLIHDLMDPAQPLQQVQRVYPILLEALLPA
ncbi:MAG: hypothetical protein KatS3mg050_2254 [Litorilinea sp.]|nr:MAG: hypothetical protein KatS3mg050_2254 [Litorilinea sp.]